MAEVARVSIVVLDRIGVNIGSESRSHNLCSVSSLVTLYHLYGLCFFERVALNKSKSNKTVEDFRIPAIGCNGLQYMFMEIGPTVLICDP